MNKRKMNTGLAILVITIVLISAIAAIASASNWPQFQYDVANTGNYPANAPDTKHIKWITEDIGAVKGSQAMIIDDRVFVYANTKVYALNKTTGTTIWNRSIPGDTQSYGSWASPAYNNSMLFVSGGYNLTKINATTGAMIQEIAFPDGNIYSCNGGPTVVDGVVFVGSGLPPYEDTVNRSHYYAFNESDLTDEKWNITNGASESATSTPAVAANRVVFGNGSSLTCADKTSGNIIWSTPLAIGSVGGSAAIDVTHDRIYVTTYVWGGQSTLYALNFTNGVEDWNATINYTSSTPAISGEYIYVSGDDNAPGVTYCFNQTGVQQWTVPHGSGTVSPTIADGMLFTGDVTWSSGDGIYVYNATTGTSVWSYPHGGSSPSIAEEDNGDGMVVSIGNDGRVYAFSDRIITGDANRNGEVTAEDASTVLQMAVGSIPPNDEADMNCDGRVTSLDALLILQTTT
ncbi:MAG: Outer membrane protein assembly factor BamB [Candidatus Argoarchaeum ethanivorans]|uniref:Outer membrane protein assembly factor BamB n=1 Tax=Candidatus Argoarchaeum ethanivorans TaxID=2608793 RepID=A0A811TC28_9EURY|nr:MAG: Outer membrane protein assembly factor BamB [Candidatus Argoarchaeum ethanivorans]